jgi:membrane-bound lytic murein transglycosylase MltF
MVISRRLSVRIAALVCLAVSGTLAVNAEEPEVPPDAGEMLPAAAQRAWQPWIGDFDGMVERRVVRAVVPYGGYQYYFDKGRPRGATYELLLKLEGYINERLQRRHIKVHVFVVPVSRDQLVPALLNGNADLIAGDLTATTSRSAVVDFARPMLTNVNEVVVTGPAAPELETLDDLAGQRIFLRRSSSYFEHLQQLALDMHERGLAQPVLLAADELLEAEDMLEMVNAGMVPMTIMDAYKARFWAQVYPDIVVRDDLVVRDSGEIAWALRQDSPEFAEIIDSFLRKYGKGTLVGNDTYKRYLSSAKRVRCANVKTESEYVRKLEGIFQKYGNEYGFEWLMLAAQGYQESGLRQSRKSPAGAIGIMQIKPSTAADRNVGIDDVTTEDSNIHAGTKYMRFIADRYFDKPGIDRQNQWLFSLAAYNAGPAKINRYRREAEQAGYDPDSWFDNVEIIVAKRIGRETVTYVSNVFKYYVGYQLTSERNTLMNERHGAVLSGCSY